MKVIIKAETSEKKIAISMLRYLIKMKWALPQNELIPISQEFIQTCPDYDITNVQNSLFYVDWGKNLVAKYDYVIDDDREEGWMDLMAAHRLAVKSFVERKQTRKRSKR